MAAVRVGIPVAVGDLVAGAVDAAVVVAEADADNEAISRCAI